jgi:hypothetical protein
MRLHGAHTFLAFVACVARCCHQVADACSTHSPSQQPCHSPSERRRRVRLCRLEQPLLCAPARGAVEAASEQLAAISAPEECGGSGSHCLGQQHRLQLVRLCAIRAVHTLAMGRPYAAAKSAGLRDACNGGASGHLNWSRTGAHRRCARCCSSGNSHSFP